MSKSRKLEGLTSRTKNILLYQGLKTKKEVRHAINTGFLHLGKSENPVWGYGRKTHKEVCVWAGIPFEDIPLSAKMVPKYISYLEKRGYKVTAPRGES